MNTDNSTHHARWQHPCPALRHELVCSHTATAHLELLRADSERVQAQQRQHAVSMTSPTAHTYAGDATYYAIVPRQPAAISAQSFVAHSLRATMSARSRKGSTDAMIRDIEDDRQLGRGKSDRRHRSEECRHRRDKESKSESQTHRGRGAHHDEGHDRGQRQAEWSSSSWALVGNDGKTYRTLTRSSTRRFALRSFPCRVEEAANATRRE